MQNHVPSRTKDLVYEILLLDKKAWKGWRLMEEATKGATAARQLLRRYEQGVYTRLELLTLLVQAAAEHSPSELAQALPAEWLQAIQENISSPPGSPADALYISGILGGHNFDYETSFAEMRQTWYEGAWNWHRYFA